MTKDLTKDLVITYQAPDGATIDLTQVEIARHERQGTWPRNSIGQEYCTLVRGLHEGLATSELERWGGDEPPRRREGSALEAKEASERAEYWRELERYAGEVDAGRMSAMTALLRVGRLGGLYSSTTGIMPPLTEHYQQPKGGK